MNEILYHISSDPGITRFVPRPDRIDKPDRLKQDVVWAVDEAHLVNRLLPLDCPRVTFGICATTIPADITRFMTGTTARRVIAIESAWFPRLPATTLYCYEFASDGFVLNDAPAGYYVTHIAVTPHRVHQIDDILAALLKSNVELRVLPTLWPLRDAVVDSTLEFSIMRMRFAQPPLDGYVPKY